MNILSYRTSFRAWWLNEAADFDGNANHIVLYSIKKTVNYKKLIYKKSIVTFTFITLKKKQGNLIGENFGENYSSARKYLVTFPQRKISPVIFGSNHFLTFLLSLILWINQ